MIKGIYVLTYERRLKSQSLYNCAKGWLKGKMIKAYKYLKVIRTKKTENYWAFHWEDYWGMEWTNGLS